VFLATMERIVPWAELCAVVEPHYPKAWQRAPAGGLERMLRMYFVQHWFNLADAACEDALCLTAQRCALRGHRPWARAGARRHHAVEVPPAAGEHKLGRHLFAKVGEVLQAQGMKVGTGTIVDATIIAHQARPRTPKSSATRRCTRRARASSGTSA
jgi:IS5 family transposase